MDVIYNVIYTFATVVMKRIYLQLRNQQLWINMSYMLPHLHNGWQVDQAILSEEDRVLVIRFGHDWDPTCMKMDEVLYSIAEKV